MYAVCNITVCNRLRVNITAVFDDPAAKLAFTK